MKHLLVTNDFPPKLGGIQSYLWELWRRLPPDDTTVLTTPYAGAAEWDAEQPFRVVRARSRVLLPTPALAREIDRLAAEVGAELVVLDPVLPVGALGPQLERPYGLVVHGAEITVPGRLPLSRAWLGRTLRSASVVVAAGPYPARESLRVARSPLPIVNVPPGVDGERFRPLTADERAKARADLGLPTDGLLVAGISRLVPRKGFDVLIEAMARVRSTHPQLAPLTLAIAGGGRDAKRLERVARTERAPVQFCGRVPDQLLPALYGCADVFAMLCRNRWGGLEQEGFGIVFLEAAAAGVPALAGASGGAADAVVDGETGLIVDRPADVDAVAGALARLLGDSAVRRRMGSEGRVRAVDEFAYDVLAARLHAALCTWPERQSSI